MVFAIIALLFALAMPLEAAGSFNLTPNIEKFDFEGTHQERVIFLRGSARISYNPPPQWAISGGPDSVVLTPPKIAQAGVTISRMKIGRPGSFDASRVALLAQDAAANIPSGSQKVVLEPGKLSSFKVDGGEVFEVAGTYTFYGQEFETTLFYVNAQEEIIRFRVTSRPANFEKLYAAVRQSLFTWSTL